MDGTQLKVPDQIRSAAWVAWVADCDAPEINTHDLVQRIVDTVWTMTVAELNRNDRVSTVIRSHVYGYMLALEDVLNDINASSTLGELKDSVLKTYQEAEATRKAIKGAITRP